MDLGLVEALIHFLDFLFLLRLGLFQLLQLLLQFHHLFTEHLELLLQIIDLAGKHA